jgi:RNA polymerase sigma factor (sigma-70 family)
MPIESDHIGMIWCIASRMLRRLPSSIDVGDLIAEGYFGLRQAIERFDRSKGESFESFARPRIRGAILDGMRARGCLSQRLRRPDAPEFVPLKPEMLCRTDADRGQAVESLHHLLQRLPRRSRLVLVLYDLEHMSMKQIATCFGVTEARVSTLRKRAIAALRNEDQDHR